MGAYSHVLLDSIMHGDVRPFAPFSEDNGVLGMISLVQLHLLCLGLGMVGGALLLLSGQRKGLLKENREP